jgi:hypothetical protein
MAGLRLVSFQIRAPHDPHPTLSRKREREAETAAFCSISHLWERDGVRALAN